MGSFINNIHIYGLTEQDVINVLKPTIKAPAHVAVSGINWVSVYPAESEAVQDLAQKLSAELSTGVFAMMVHDDDILFFHVFEHGMMVDEFNSNPLYFSDTTGDETGDEEAEEANGNPDVLLKYALPGTPASEIRETLEEIKLELFASHGLTSLAHIFGIDDTCARATSRHIKRGETIPGIELRVVTPEG